LQTPEAHHRTRADAAEHQAQGLERRADRLSAGRGILFAGTLGFLVAAWTGPLPWAVALAPGVGFLVLVVLHLRTLDARGRARRRGDYHHRALERMAGRWPGVGPDGAAWRESGHPYQTDLDLLGPGSLFQLLCAARTRDGQARLADWLSVPADRATLLDRQAAVAELAPDPDLRERMALAGDEARMDVDPAEVGDWARRRTRGALRPWSVVAALASAGLLVALAGWLLRGWSPWGVVAGMAVAYLVHLGVARRHGATLEGVQAPAVELSVLARLLAEAESLAPRHPSLQQLHARLTRGGAPPSRRIRGLRRRLEALDWDRNMLFAPLAAVLLWRAQSTLALEAWRRDHAAEAVDWLEALGDLEALQSLARHAFEHPEDAVPILEEGAPRLDAVRLGHPLLPREEVVRNDVRLGDDLRLLVVSGSNMSGKSTLLRAVGSNVVLALAGGVVRAGSLRLTPLAVAASIRAEDSLLAGSSRFRAELDRMRVVLALTRGPLPVLFLLDEIFHGTHSHDRRRGAQGFLTRLLDRGALGLVTTHDLALTHLEGRLAEVGRNVHFQDDVVEGEMVFDYRMREGVVEKSNALALMAAEGLIGPEGTDPGTSPSDAPN